MFKVGGFKKIGKKKIIFLIIIILLLLIGGVFWWQEDKIESYLEQKEMERVLAPAREYVIIDVPEGKIIENKKDGFKIKIPDNWEAVVGMDIGGSISDWEVAFFSSNLKYRPYPPEGCIGEIRTSRLKEYKEGFFVKNVQDIKRMINTYKEEKLKGDSEYNEYSLGYKVIEVNNLEAIKQTYIATDGKTKSIFVEIPGESNVYSFTFAVFSSECEKDIDEILKTISIR